MEQQILKELSLWNYWVTGHVYVSKNIYCPGNKDNKVHHLVTGKINFRENIYASHRNLGSK